MPETAETHYLAQTLDDAYEFMQAVLAHPVRECGERCVDLVQAAAEVGVRVVFPPTLKLSRFPRVFQMRESLVPRLLTVAEAFLRRDWLLRVEDAYRSVDVQRDGARSDFVFDEVYRMASRETGRAQPSAALLFKRMFVFTALTPRLANHVCGSAVDITPLNATTAEEVDLGGRYPQFSIAMPMASPFISATARRNRSLCNELMAECGFVPYPYEFWHYSQGDADCELLLDSGQPGRFGPVDLNVETGAVQAVDDPEELFITADEIAARLPRVK